MREARLVTGLGYWPICSVIEGRDMTNWTNRHDKSWQIVTNVDNLWQTVTNVEKRRQTCWNALQFECAPSSFSLPTGKEVRQLENRPDSAIAELHWRRIWNEKLKLFRPGAVFKKSEISGNYVIIASLQAPWCLSPSQGSFGLMSLKDTCQMP